MAYIQSAETTNTGTSAAVAFTTSNVTTNNRIISLGDCNHGDVGTSTITDTPGNTYHNDSDFSDSVGNYRSVIGSAPITSGGGTKPTVTWSTGTSGPHELYIAEYSNLTTSTGAAAVDTTGTGAAGSQSTYSWSASPNPSVAGGADPNAIGLVLTFNGNGSDPFTTTNGTKRLAALNSGFWGMLTDIASVVGTTTLSGSVAAPGNGGNDHTNMVVYKLPSTQAPFILPLPGNPTGPVFPSDLRTFANPVEIQLIGKDVQFGGAGKWKTYDYPNPRGYVSGISLKTHTEAYKWQLLGLDKQFRGVGQWQTYDYPNPVGHDPRSAAWPVVILRTWIDAFKVLLVGKDVQFRGPGQFATYDYPNPVGHDLRSKAWPVVALRTFVDTLKVLLTGKDVQFGGAGQWKTFDYPNPPGPSRVIDLLTQAENWLLQTTLVFVLKPFGLLDWPNPIVRIRRKMTNVGLLPPVGQDSFRGGPGQVLTFDWPNPRLTAPAADLRTWLGNLLESTLAVVAKPFGLLDWPNPFARLFPIDLRSFLNALEIPLIGQDTFFGAAGQAMANLDWPVPNGKRPSIDLKTWLQGIVTTTLVGLDALPSRLSDWPNPLRADRLPGISLKTWLDPLKQWLVGLDFLPFKLTDWPVPLRVLQRIDLRTWTVNVLQNTLLPIIFPFNLLNWPNPPGPPRRSPGRFGFLNLNLGLDQFFGAPGQPPTYDWPNPRLAIRSIDLRTAINNLLQSTLLVTIFPFSMLDWPNPREYLRSISLRTWLDDLKVRLIGADVLPFGLDDWPNPVTILRSIDLRTWLQNLSRFAPLFIPPFFLTEWPVPAGKQFAISLRTFVDGVRLNLIGRDFLPFAMTDWPVPKVRLPGIDLRTFVDRLRMQLIGKDFLPFFQSNWPVPRGYARATDLLTSIWNPLYALITSIFKLPVGKTAYQATIHGILSTSSTLVGPSGFASVIEASTAYGNAP